MKVVSEEKRGNPPIQRQNIFIF